MGCYPPLGKMVSKALRKCKGRKRHGGVGGTTTTIMDQVYSPPPTYSGSVARHVTFTNVSPPVVVMPPEPTHVVPPVSVSISKQYHHAPPPEAVVMSPSPQPDEVPSHMAAAARPQPTHVRFAAAAGEPDRPIPHPNRNESTTTHARFDAGTHGGPPNRKEVRLDAGPSRHEAYPGGSGSGSGSGYRYMTSPLPRWEEEGERRREYFGGEYHYYPTPIREGIYRIATDENRLTTIFSEENPNACTII